MERTLVHFLDDLLIIIVIYEIKIGESPAFSSLTNALNSVSCSSTFFIYDNSSVSQAIPENNPGSLFYYHDAINPGVSKAYNEGFKKAKAIHKKWLLISDQDTGFPAGYFEKVKATMNTCTSDEFFVPVLKNESWFVSPFRFKLGRGVVLNEIDRQSYPLDHYRFINSGLLISVALFEKCGGYDERFPLDFSDLAFAHRIMKYQDKFVVIPATCTHHLSSEEQNVTLSLGRFARFINASRLYGEVFDLRFILFINRFFRALKLGWQFRSFEFVKCLFQNTKIPS